MTRSSDGWFEITLPERPFGNEYCFALSDGSVVPDPASRGQHDVLGSSTLVDPDGYSWKNAAWRGREWRDAVFYEIHVGTFTEEGTFRAAAERLTYLAGLGFTAIEMMPIAHFPGLRGWGYDGVFQYAPFGPYGTTDDLKSLVDTAHGLGLMVFLDVVYNHFGPEGNFLSRYASAFFHDENSTPWGPRIDFSAMPVRRFFIENALYWLDEFHLDGLRLDAVDQIEDESDTHFLEELAREVRSSISDRTIHLITENPVNGTDLLAVRDGGLRLYEADWNDDFHHAVHAAATGERTGHYQPFSRHPWRQAAAALAQGYLSPGRRVLKSVEPPDSADLPTNCFVHFLQNHDQVGNRAIGDRLHMGIDPDLHTALTEMLLLSPQVPLMFQGDDHLSTQPFKFFADYNGKLRENVWQNREREAINFGGFPSGFGPENLDDPSLVSTFQTSKLRWERANDKRSLVWQEFLKRLFAVRAAHIVPLLGQQLIGGWSPDAPEECIFVDWEHPKAKVKLRANMGAESVFLGKDVDATTEIYPGKTQGGCELGSRNVRVYIERNPNA